VAAPFVAIELRRKEMEPREEGVATELFVVKTSFTDRYHDILYTFCVLAVVGTVGTVEKP
jgi:hypothetical protein